MSIAGDGEDRRRGLRRLKPLPNRAGVWPNELSHFRRHINGLDIGPRAGETCGLIGYLRRPRAREDARSRREAKMSISNRRNDLDALAPVAGNGLIDRRAL